MKVRNMILDATASNRGFWNNKNPPYTIFMDRELTLHRPPDIFADFRFCPFRDNVFDCVIFDPPYYIRRDNNWHFWNPEGTKVLKGRKEPVSHYGLYRSKTELLTNILGGAKEFYRISKRLCFQWGEGFLSIWQILPLFKPWIKIYQRKNKKRKGLKKKSDIYWTTFVRCID